MKKGKILSTTDDMFEKCEKRAIIHRDPVPPNPLKDYDQIFLLHSNIRDLCGNENDKDYRDPLVEIEDEDGYGTGEFTFKEGVVAFPVSAYIHSGIALHMGSIREFPFDPGGFDTTRNAAWMWTTRERFEKMCGPWMELYDEETKSRRQAKDEKEFRDYLYKMAKCELELFQKYLDGYCYWYETEVKRKFTKVYENGEKVEAHEWEDGGDSCGGFYVDKVGDIDFPKEEGWGVFADDDCSHLVGDDYDIPEFVVLKVVDGVTQYLTDMCNDGKRLWTTNLEDADIYRRWGLAQVEAQKAIPKEEYDAYKNIKEIDDLRGK